MAEDQQTEENPTIGTRIRRGLRDRGHNDAAQAIEIMGASIERMTMFVQRTIDAAKGNTLDDQIIHALGDWGKPIRAILPNYQTEMEAADYLLDRTEIHLAVHTASDAEFQKETTLDIETLRAVLNGLTENLQLLEEAGTERDTKANRPPDKEKQDLLADAYVSLTNVIDLIDTVHEGTLENTFAAGIMREFTKATRTVVKTIDALDSNLGHEAAKEIKQNFPPALLPRNIKIENEAAILSGEADAMRADVIKRRHGRTNLTPVHGNAPVFVEKTTDIYWVQADGAPERSARGLTTKEVEELTRNQGNIHGMSFGQVQEAMGPNITLLAAANVNTETGRITHILSESGVVEKEIQRVVAENRDAIIAGKPANMDISYRGTIYSPDKSPIKRVNRMVAADSQCMAHAMNGLTYALAQINDTLLAPLVEQETEKGKKPILFTDLATSGAVRPDNQAFDEKSPNREGDRGFSLRNMAVRGAILGGGVGLALTNGLEAIGLDPAELLQNPQISQRADFIVGSAVIGVGASLVITAATKAADKAKSWVDRIRGNDSEQQMGVGGR